MKFVADLHLHSRYSRAVSQNMTLENIAKYAQLKGISIVATGDFTHPFWFDQLKTELVDAGNGLYRLKTNDQRLTQKDQALDVSPSALDEKKVYFLLSCEISSIYSQGGKGRRIHNLFFFPSLAAVSKFNKKLLDKKANLRSDGRPIVGIPSRDLAQIALSCDEKVLIIPAHIWTPWFSLYGSFSGFDSVEECFGDMAKYIYGIETGLSSDPAMNWQIADLENRAILSSSDAHSLLKMGREATVFEADEISYDAIYHAIAGPVTTFPPASARSSQKTAVDQKDQVELRAVGSPSSRATRNDAKIAFTIEFHPEEGKYHYTGHRDCNFSQSPEETAKDGDICAVCGKKLTIGVMHRVEQLKSQNSKVRTEVRNGVRWVYPDGNGRPPYVSLVPLSEILSEALESGIGTKTVMDPYMALVSTFASEFNVLLKADIEQIASVSSSKIAQGIEKVRTGDIVVGPGYDGKFGVVKIWNQQNPDKNEKNEAEEKQLNLFA